MNNASLVFDISILSAKFSSSSPGEGQAAIAYSLVAPTVCFCDEAMRRIRDGRERCGRTSRGDFFFAIVFFSPEP